MDLFTSVEFVLLSLFAVCPFCAVLSSQTTLAFDGAFFDFCEPLLGLLPLLPFDGVFDLPH